MELFTITVILTTVGLLTYYLLRWMSYLERLGIACEMPLPILGNMAPIVLRRANAAVELNRLYKKYADRSYFGFYDFMTPTVVVRDPELIRSLTVKHFDSFVDHRRPVDEELDPLMGGNLFGLRGNQWRKMRKLLSPAFSASKMKMMYGLMCDCAENFTEHLYRDCQGGKVIHVKEIFSRFTTDVIASCAFGINVNTMRDPNNDFYVLAKKTLTFDTILSLKIIFSRNLPFLMRLLNIRMFSEEVTRFFTNIVESTVKLRDETGLYRPDMIQLMMGTRGKSNGAQLTIKEMTAQAFSFFLAGFDGSASFQAFLAHALALNPDVQEKLREEIKDVLRKREGRPTYEDILQMEYMDAFFNETLRFYPPLVFLDRVCVKEFELPPAAPATKPVILKQGDALWFLPFSIQHDPQYYSEPDKFDPDRFMHSHPDPSIHLTFGIGPRSCIGNRFALIESKILMFYLLSNCILEACDETTVTMDFDAANLQLTPRTGFWLRITSIDRPLMSLGKNLPETVANSDNTGCK